MCIQAIDKQSSRCQNNNTIPNKHKGARTKIIKAYQSQPRSLCRCFLQRPIKSYGEFTEWGNKHSVKTSGGVVDMKTGYSSTINHGGRIHSELQVSQRCSIPPATVSRTQSTHKYTNILYRLKESNEAIKGFEVPETYLIHPISVLLPQTKGRRWTFVNQTYPREKQSYQPTNKDDTNEPNKGMEN